MTRERKVLVALLAVAAAIMAVFLATRGGAPDAPAPGTPDRTAADEAARDAQALVRPEAPAERDDAAPPPPSAPAAERTVEPVEPSGPVAGAALPPCELRLRFVTEQGLSVPDAVVRIDGEFAGDAKGEHAVDGDGRLSLEVERPTRSKKLMIAASAPGRENVRQFLEPDELLRHVEDESTLEIPMGPATWIDIVVRDMHGEPAAEAQVRLHFEGDSGISVGHAEVFTDAEGRTRADGLRPGTWGAQVVQWRNYWSMDTVHFPVEPGGGSVELEVERMDAVDHASGRIVGPGGEVLTAEGYDGLYARRVGSRVSNAGGGIYDDGFFVVTDVENEIERWEIADRDGPRSDPFDLSAGWHDVVVHLRP